MPTWYYFSRPSNMAFHDFTKRHKPQKNLRSLLGLGLKFIPTPSLTNSWSRLKKSSYDRLFRSVHLRFHFAGKPPAKVQLPTTQNCTSIRHGHLHIGQYPQLPWRNAYHAFLQLLTNSSNHEKAKQIFCLNNTEHYERYNNNKRSLSFHAIRTSDPRLSNVTTI